MVCWEQRHILWLQCWFMAHGTHFSASVCCCCWHFVIVPKEKGCSEIPLLPPSWVMHTLPLKMMMNYSPFIVLECAHGDQNLVHNTEFFTMVRVQLNYGVVLHRAWFLFCFSCSGCVGEHRFYPTFPTPHVGNLNTILSPKYLDLFHVCLKFSLRK